MRVENCVFKLQKQSFKGIKEDKANVEQLSKSTNPILPNNKRNILASLNNIAQVPSDDNLNFLLDTAGSLNYGLRKNSQFAAILDSDSKIPTEADKENTKWNELLKNAIQRGMDSSESPKKNELKERFEHVFVDELPLSEPQQKILDARAKLLSAKEMQNAIEDSDKLIHSAKIAENLDYFIASSEISTEQKLACLDKMNFFLSDDYKINPQLQDKKLQALDEMLNDMVIQTPAQKPLLIKQVNQRQTGMCAAISVCRKQLAYEDKVNYMEVLMNELDDKPTMKVFDVTKLSEQKKVNAKKTYIDFNDALSKGYRIIDASAHQWMHLGGSSGDGSVNSKTYTPFDKDNYEIYRDSRWYSDLPEEFQPAQNYLRHLIKENHAVEEIEQRYKAQDKIKHQIGDFKNTYLISVEKGTAKLSEYLNELAPSASSTERAVAVKKLINLEKANDLDVKIHPTDSNEYKGEKIAKFIKKEFPYVNSLMVKKQIGKITSMYDEVNSANQKLDKLSSFNQPKSKYNHSYNLFNLASTHRKSVESELQIPGKVKEYSFRLGLPMQEQETVNQIALLKKNLSSQNIVNNLATNLGVAPDSKTVNAELNKLSQYVEVMIPAKLDSILSAVSMGNRATMLSSILSQISESVNEGNKDSIEKFALNANVQNNKQKVVAKLNDYQNILANEPTNKQLAEITHSIGYDSEIMFAASMVNSFIASLSSPVDEQTRDIIMENLGNPVSVQKAIESIANDLNSLSFNFNQIQEALQIPSREDEILKKLENSGFILSTKSLDFLQKRFDEVAAVRLENEKKRQNGETVKVDNSLYSFTPEQKTLFDKIEKSYTAIRKYSKLNYSDMNAYLAPQLSKMYGETGKASGNFWLAEEGSSGLMDNESVRITEQMTGKPYYIESNPIAITKKIKEGKGSGTSTTSVLHTQPALHAQYVADVSSVEMLDPASKQKVIKDVLWHDNSWGPAENEGKWIADDGLYHTDYASGYGGEKGYIFGSDFKTGTLVSDIMSKTVKYHSGDELVEFPMFENVVLQGNAPEGMQKISELYSYIFKMDPSYSLIDDFEKTLAADSNINIKALENLDVEAESASELAKKQLKEIDSKQKYEMLPDSNFLKLYVEKTALMLSVSDVSLKNQILELNSMNEVKKLRKNLILKSKQSLLSGMYKTGDVIPLLEDAFFDTLDSVVGKSLSDEAMDEVSAAIFDVKNSQFDGSLDSLRMQLTKNISKAISAKFPDEKMANDYIDKLTKELDAFVQEEFAINSVSEFVQKNSDTAKLLLPIIDKKYAPESEDEIIKILNKYQSMTRKEFMTEIEGLSSEELGIFYKQPFDIVKLVNSTNEEVAKAFEEVIGTQVIFNGIIDQAKLNNKQMSDDEILTISPQAKYRNLYIELTNLDSEKYIKKYRAQVFDKYKLRPAFPQLQIVGDDDLAMVLDDNIQALVDNANSIVNNKYNMNLNSVVKSLLSGIKSYSATSSIADYDSLKLNIAKLSSILAEDETSVDLQKTTAILLKDLGDSKVDVDLDALQKDASPIFAFGNQLKQNGVTEQNFKDSNDAILKNSKSFISSLVKANIQPRYQDDAIREFNEWFKAYVNEPESDETISLEEDLKQFFLDRHITKAPIELLHSFVKEVQSPSADTSIKDALKEFLTQAEKAALMTQVEYKMVKNENAAIASRTADFMKYLSLKTVDGKNVALNSDSGIAYIMNLLSSPANDNSTLKLFLTQTGLMEKAVDIMTSDFDEAAAKKYLDSLADSIISNYNIGYNLNQLFNSFINDSKIQYSSYPDAVNHFLKVLDKNIRPANDTEAKLIDIYKEMMTNSTNTDVVKTIKPKDVIANLAQMHLLIAEQFEVANSEQLDFLNEYSYMLNDQKTLLNSLVIPEESPLNDKRKAFNQKIENAVALQQETVAKVNEYLAGFGEG